MIGNFTSKLRDLFSLSKFANENWPDKFMRNFNNRVCAKRMYWTERYGNIDGWVVGKTISRSYYDRTNTPSHQKLPTDKTVGSYVIEFSDGSKIEISTRIHPDGYTETLLNSFE